MNYRGQVIVSIVVLLMLGIDGTCILLVPMPPGADDVAKILIGGLISMCTVCVQWWLGSSHGSKVKDETIHNLAAAPQQSGGAS